MLFTIEVAAVLSCFCLLIVVLFVLFSVFKHMFLQQHQWHSWHTYAYHDIANRFGILLMPAHVSSQESDRFRAITYHDYVALSVIGPRSIVT